MLDHKLKQFHFASVASSFLALQQIPLFFKGDLNMNLEIGTFASCDVQGPALVVCCSLSDES